MSGSSAVASRKREQAPHHGRHRDQAENLPGRPRIARPAPCHRQHQHDRRADHQGGADDIELMRALVARQLFQRAVGHDERDRAHRQVDPEDERPVHAVGEHAAQHRADDARDHEHDRRIALIARPLARRHQVGDDGLGDRQDAAAADALQRARRDQRPHGGRQRAGDRTEDEDAHAGQQDAAAAVDVGQLAEQRRHRRRAQEIGRDHPGQALDVAEMNPDGRQGRGDDGLLQRAQEHGEHDAGDDLVDRGRRQRSVERGRRRVTAAHRTASWCRRSGTRGGVGAGGWRASHRLLAFSGAARRSHGTGMNGSRRQRYAAAAAAFQCRGSRGWYEESGRGAAASYPSAGVAPARLPERL